jgi:phosphopantetheinyl transferase (holo-ACP synthase)
VITPDPAGAPEIHLAGHVARHAAAIGLTDVSVSITHAGDFSAAAVVASLRPPHPGDPRT